MSRGRGRGGMSRSFNRDQLAAMGVASNEMLPTLETQPPPVYPLMERRPVPLTQSEDIDYLLLLRQDFLDHMQLSASYLKIPETNKSQPDQAIDKLVAQLSSAKDKYDWSLFPAELRPKMLAKRAQKLPAASRDVNVQEKLQTLEQMEAAKEKNRAKQPAEEVEEEHADENPEDEEMDDGTDYANNYFDNGEDYEEEDDNMDEGPIY